MTDKEWIAQIKTVTNKELLDSLEYCGHDGYYNEIYHPILKEIKRRLNGGRRRKGEQNERPNKQTGCDWADTH